MEAKLAVVGRKGRGELVRPMDPAPVNDHHDFFPDVAEGCHDLMEIVAQLLGIKMRHDVVEDFGGAILDGANDAEQHPTGNTAPGAILHTTWRVIAYDG